MGHQPETIDIPVDSVVNKYNPRPEPGSVESLAGNIAEIGQLHPITVLENGSGYELIAGQRRLLAMKLLGRLTISARVLKGISKIEALLVAVSENTQREAMTVPDIAEAALKIENATGKRDCQIAKLLGISPSIVSQARSAMAELDAAEKETLANGKAAMWLYFLLRKVPRQERSAFAVKCLEEGWTRDEAQQVARGLSPAPEKTLTIRVPISSFAVLTDFLRALLARVLVLQKQGVEAKLLPQLLRGFKPSA